MLLLAPMLLLFYHVAEGCSDRGPQLHFIRVGMDFWASTYITPSTNHILVLVEAVDE